MGGLTGPMTGAYGQEARPVNEPPRPSQTPEDQQRQIIERLMQLPPEVQARIAGRYPALRQLLVQAQGGAVGGAGPQSGTPVGAGPTSVRPAARGAVSAGSGGTAAASAGSGMTSGATAPRTARSYTSPTPTSTQPAPTRTTSLPTTTRTSPTAPLPTGTGSGGTTRADQLISGRIPSYKMDMYRSRPTNLVGAF